MTKIPYTITNESISVVYQGTPHCVQKGAPNFKSLREALFAESWDAVPGFLTVAKTIEDWAKGDFKVVGETVLYKGDPLAQELNARILLMATEGKDPSYLLRFWERLQLNPSSRSVLQLYKFLEHYGIPIDKDGFIMAYKGVRNDYRDCHTGTVDNSPGQEPSMPRNKISDDPNLPCHFGFHAGSLEYARTFGPRTVIVRIDPADVVCIPFDCAMQKMRMCKYKVIGNYGSRLDDTVFEDDDKPDLDACPCGNGVDNDGDGDCVSCVQTKKGAQSSNPNTLDYRDVNNTLFANMDQADLLEQNLGLLRSYAANVLKIVGASKIPGGKIMLVQRIIETRDGNRKI